MVKVQIESFATVYECAICGAEETIMPIETRYPSPPTEDAAEHGIEIPRVGDGWLLVHEQLPTMGFGMGRPFLGDPSPIPTAVADNADFDGEICPKCKPHYREAIRRLRQN